MQVVHNIRNTDIKEFLSSLSPKGQITIPMEIRRRFGVKPKDKIIITIEDEEVKIKPAKSRLSESYQAVPALKQPRNIREMSRIARDEHAEEAYTEGLPSNQRSS